MAKIAFWSRMGGWIRGGRRRDDEAQASDDGLLSVEQEDRFSEPGQGGDEDDGAAAERIMTAVSRRARKDHSLRKLQEGYDRVLDLMDGMQKHMRTQEDRTTEIAAALTQLSRSLADLPNVGQQQVQLLSTIAAQLETTTVRTQQLADAMGEVPRMVHSQTEAMSNVQRQLELGAESDAQLAGALQTLGRSTDRLGESAEKQASAIGELKISGEAQQQFLNDILQRQTRNFRILMVAMAILASAGITMGTIAFVLYLAG